MNSTAKVAVVGAAAFAVWSLYRASQIIEDGEPIPWDGGITDGVADMGNQVRSMFINVADSMDDANVKAFLMMIRKGESGTGSDAYRMVVGGGYFDSFNDHPRIFKKIGKGSTSAAGAYQITATTWDDIRKSYPLPDFSPASQDAAAVVLLKRRRALADVIAGKWESAIFKLRNEWTSLPGAAESRMTMQDAKRFIVAYGGLGVSEGETA